MKDVILIVEDEVNIRANIAEFLQAEDYETLLAKDGEEAIAIFDEKQPDMVILDLMLPKVDGLEVCKHIRRDSDTPIIMVTARDEEIDKLLGLELGADDYITKPFSLRELKARIKAVMRRTKSGSSKTPAEEVLTFGDMDVDLDRREVRIHGEIIELTPSEYAILVTL
ncbi:MAG: response regulator transcription factor, partial [Peptococcaceae bacterium]|nr:response regulator transcription factor [Peptococcaceae bacterium]